MKTVQPLRWALIVVTYNRGPALHRCVGYALGQTRPPQEIIIVDASTNWQEIRDSLFAQFARTHPEIRWEYQPARIRGITHQRNQAIELATSEIFFLIDDDSFMYPDCAEEIMRVYEADPAGAVAGVGAMLSETPPGDAEKPAAAAVPAPPSRPSLKQRLTDFMERRVDADATLLPYDEAYPEHPLPPAVAALDVAVTRYLQGMRMTYRREVIQRERFNEMLWRYASTEDLDASYRASRHGALLNAFRARLYHALDPSGRLTRYVCSVLGLINMAALYRLHGRRPRALLRAFGARIALRVGANTLRDLARRRFTLPYARADLFALTQLGHISRMDEDALRRWLPAFQNDLIERNPS
ncbi:MAG TPA: glycosyltransferase [Gemmataceae bacterium]|nr:glycosyltransferase [Gemmataceae bacterium]